MRRAKKKSAYALFLATAFLLMTMAPTYAQDAAGTFKMKCAVCHGANGDGNTAVGKKLMVRDLASPDVQKQTDADLAAIIGKGKNKMPPYRNSLNDGQIKDLVGYIRTLAKK